MWYQLKIISVEHYEKTIMNVCIDGGENVWHENLGKSGGFIERFVICGQLMQNEKIIFAYPDYIVIILHVNTIYGNE